MSLRSRKANPEEKKSLNWYASSVLKDSSIGAISGMVSPISNTRKVFKIATFVIFLGVFIYQIKQFSDIYFEYPTLVVNEKMKPDQYILPAFTFCSKSWIYYFRLCEKYPTACHVPAKFDEVCNEYPHFCTNNGTSVPKHLDLEQHAAEQNVSLSVIFEAVTVGFGKILGYMHFSGDEVGGPFIRRNYLNSNVTDIYACYSLHARWNSSHPPAVYANVKGKDATDYGVIRNTIYDRSAHPDNLHHLLFAYKYSESLRPSEVQSILLTVHSPFEISDPLENGTLIEEEKVYRLNILNIKEERLLPYPYKTDCWNYTERRIRNNNNGPTSQKMCEEECNADFTLSTRACIKTGIYSKEGRPCTREDYKVMMNDLLSEETSRIAECEAKCKPDCFKIQFQFEVKEEKTNQKFTERLLFKSYILLIYTGDLEMTLYTHKQQYEFVELFSYIGGFIGIWLGISLVQVAELLEALLCILRYSAKNML